MSELALFHNALRLGSHLADVATTTGHRLHLEYRAITAELSTAIQEGDPDKNPSMALTDKKNDSMSFTFFSAAASFGIQFGQENEALNKVLSEIDHQEFLSRNRGEEFDTIRAKLDVLFREGDPQNRRRLGALAVVALDAGIVEYVGGRSLWVQWNGFKTQLEAGVITEAQEAVEEWAKTATATAAQLEAEVIRLGEGNRTGSHIKGWPW